MAPVPTTSAVAPVMVRVSRCRHSCRRCRSQLVQQSLAWAITAPSTYSAIGRSKTPRALVTHHVGVPQPVEEQRVDACGGDVDPLQAVGSRPRRPHGGREEVPQQQRPRAHDGRREAVGARSSGTRLQRHRDRVAVGRRSHSTATTGRVRGTRPRLGTEPYDCQQSACDRTGGAPRLGPWAIPPPLQQVRDRRRRAVRLRARPRAVAMGARRHHPAPDPHAVLAAARHRGDGGAHLATRHWWRRASTDLRAVAPLVMAYACTSGSFVGGLAGERALVSAMLDAGAPAAVTTSGALLEALRHLELTRIAVATPYDADLTARPRRLPRGGRRRGHRGRRTRADLRIWTVPYDVTAGLVRETDTADAKPSSSAARTCRPTT